jgi:hypothetical protein
VENTIKILIDLKKEMYRFDQAQQGDDVILDLTILENGVSKDLTGATIELIYINANNTVASVTGDNIVISGNNVKITCPRDCTRSYGIAKFQLKITSQDKQVSTFPLALTIVPGVDQGQPISQNISTILEELTTMNIKSKETLESLNEWIETHGEMKEQLNNLKIGVRNLLSNGDFTKGLKEWKSSSTGTVLELVKSNFPLNYLKTSKSVVWTITLGKFASINKGDQVTVTFKGRYEGSAFAPSFKITNAEDDNPMSDRIYVNTTSSWKEHSFTFTAKTNGDTGHRLYIYCSGDDAILTHLTDIKIELGEKSTGFIPSTEDINEVIDLKQNGGNIGTVNIKNVNTTTDSVETTKKVLGLYSTNSSGLALGMEVDTGLNSIKPNSHALEAMTLGTASMPWARLYAKEVMVNNSLTLRTANASADSIITKNSNLEIYTAAGLGVNMGGGAFHPNLLMAGSMELGRSNLPWGKIHGTSMNLGGSLTAETNLTNEDFVYTTKKQLSVHMGEDSGLKTGVTLLEEILRPYAGSANKISLGINEAPWKDVFVTRTSGEVRSLRERTKFFIVQVNGTTAATGNTSVPYPISTNKSNCFLVGGYVIKSNGVANDVSSMPFFYYGNDMVLTAVEANRTYCLTFAILRE